MGPCTTLYSRAAKPAISGHTAFFLEILSNFYDICDSTGECGKVEETVGEDDKAWERLLTAARSELKALGGTEGVAILGF